MVRRSPAVDRSLVTLPTPGRAPPLLVDARYDRMPRPGPIAVPPVVAPTTARADAVVRRERPRGRFVRGAVRAAAAPSVPQVPQVPQVPPVTSAPPGAETITEPAPVALSVPVGFPSPSGFRPGGYSIRFERERPRDVSRAAEPGGFRLTLPQVVSMGLLVWSMARGGT